MTSHDVRDMLDLPGTAGPRSAKKQKIAAPKPVLKGLAREVAGLAGDAPIAIVPEITVFKKKRVLNRKPAARWVLQPFKNSAREDDMVLRHWRRKQDEKRISVGEDGEQVEVESKAEPEVEESTFAKFNVHVKVPQYDDEQYSSKLSSEDWSQDETDYLMKLVGEYDLRWPVIWDRYNYAPPDPQGDVPSNAMVLSPKSRSMEDLKQRYYDVAAKVMALNKHPSKMSNSEFMLHELMANFNAAQETNRKKFAENFMKRTRDEANEEQSLLVELKRILLRSEKLNQERKELYELLDAPPSTANIGMFTTSQGLQQLLQQMMTADKSKKRKSIMGSDGISPSGGPSGPQQSSLDRRDSTNRESISGPSTANNKKGPQGQSERRQLTEEEERMYGVSHHERITTSGPAFRHEKISKPIASRSVIQQQKIMNTLGELKIPSRLIIPTAEIGAAFDSLLNSIHVMLEAKKVSDKLTGEINLLKAQKLEREKRERAERGEPEPEPEPELEEAGAVGNGDAAKQGDGDEVSVKVEEGEKEKSVAASTRAGSVHKRSASVMSAVSDKSAKRQKK